MNNLVRLSFYALFTIFGAVLLKIYPVDCCVGTELAKRSFVN